MKILVWAHLIVYLIVYGLASVPENDHLNYTAMSGGAVACPIRGINEAKKNLFLQKKKKKMSAFMSEDINIHKDNPLI